MAQMSEDESQDKTIPVPNLVHGEENHERSLLSPDVLFVGRFRIARHVGQGGMGDVYEAQDVAMRRLVAIKVLLPDLTSNSQRVQRFQREAQVVGRLDHPNIVRVYEFSVSEDQRPYLVMDFCQGKSLDQELRQSTVLDTRVAIDICAKICTALEHAHERGVVHRDLKPSNVMLYRNGDGPEVKVLDFGIAKLLVDDNSPELTRTGEIFGSPFYMSPEQINGGDITGKTDQYSLGCVLYECLTGAPPHVGSNPIDTCIKHQTSQHLPLKEASMGKTFDPRLEEVVNRLLKKAPEDRFASMSHVRQALLSANDAQGIAEASVASKSGGNRFLPAKLPIAVVLASAGVLIALSAAALMWGPGVIASFSHGESEPKQEKSSQPTVSSDIKTKEPAYMSRLLGEEIAVNDASVEGYLKVHQQYVKYDLKDFAPISNKGLSAFPNCLRAREIFIDGNPYITDEGMKMLSHLPLKSLSLAKTGVSIKGLDYINKSDLSDLDMSSTKLSDADVPKLAEARKLTRLYLANIPLTGTTLGSLAHLDLERLDLNNTKVNDKGIEQIKGLKLRILTLDNTPITNKALGYLSKMPLLHLSIERTNVSDKGLKLLSANKDLKALKIVDCPNITSRGIEAFQKEHPHTEVTSKDAMPSAPASRLGIPIP
jgi:serine/threonine protein kinase